MDLNEIAELSGIIIGDGSIHKSANRITIIGSYEDKIYFENRISPMFNRNFGINPIIRKNKYKNSFNMTIENSKTYDFFINEIGLNYTNKKNAKVPEFVLNKTEYICSFLRGIFDTDGSLKFSKQKKVNNYYPRVQISLIESPIAHQISDLFRILNFNFAKWIENNNRSYSKNNAKIVYYHISGDKNLTKWMTLIKPGNLVHITKYKIWKKYGHYIPKTTLKKRMECLNCDNVLPNLYKQTTY